MHEFPMRKKKKQLFPEACIAVYSNEMRSLQVEGTDHSIPGML